MKTVEFEALGAKVRGYIHEDYPRLVTHKVRPALVVCPGGGYYYVCPREADPPALAFSAIGYNVFIVEYSVLENASCYRPLRQLAQTFHIIREHSTEWHIDPARIAVLGFSAGGHLAASLGALWNDSTLFLPGDCRPDAVMLCYPVISLFDHTHQATSDNVSGGDEAVREALSIEKRITEHMPPTFVWHTVDDPSVPVENSLMLIKALKEKGVSFECHLFMHGAHGMSTCTQEVETPNAQCAEWVGLCKTWLNTLFDYTV